MSETRVPLRIQIGDGTLRTVAHLDSFELAYDSDTAMVTALRRLADEIERQHKEQEQR